MYKNMQKGTEKEESIRKLKIKAMSLSPLVWIGKKGVTDEVINETKKQLKINGLVKVKLLRPSFEGKGKKGKKEIAQALAERTGSDLISVIGFVATLYKAPEKDKTRK